MPDFVGILIIGLSANNNNFLYGGGLGQGWVTKTYGSNLFVRKITGELR